MNTIDFLLTDIFAFGLVFLRITGFATMAPFIRENYIPPRFRVLGAILFTALLFRKITGDMQPVGFAEFFFLGIMEFAIGAALGFGMNLIFMAIRSAGSQMGQMIGLRFHMMNTGEEPIGLGELLMIFTAFFVISSGGDRYMIQVFIDLYEKIPIGAFKMGVVSMRPTLELGTAFFKAIIKLSLPIIGVILTFYLLVGIFQHFFQNWDIFAMVFPGAVFIGLWAIALMAPNIIIQASQIFKETVNSLGNIF
ncbi:MAG: flagellar biosynthetic protein FliR [Candidatus Zixiibacteriota bacterium]